MNNKEKTFIILSPGFAINEAHSVCLPPQQSFIKTLKKAFPEMKIIILAFEFPHTIREYEWNEIRVIPFNGEFKRKLNKLLIWFRIWKKLRQLTKRTQVIGLFSFWCADCALLGKYFGRKYGLKHFTWILGQDAKKNNHFIKWIRPNTNELVAMSDFLAKEFFSNHGILPAHIIPNGIDTELFPLSAHPRDIDVLGVGSLITLKQYDLFIQLIAELREKNPTIQAMICGKGPEKNKLEALIKALKLENNIILAGELEHPEILALMQRSKVFLHPSCYEGFSTVCLEALYAGAQVISFCRPMNQQIPHWRIAENAGNMLEWLNEILGDSSVGHEAVLPYSMIDSARELMKLYR